MGEHILGRRKKILGILLLTLFIMSIAVVPVSARLNSNSPTYDMQESLRGYYNGLKKGSLDGYSYGYKLGYNDCSKPGRPYNPSFGKKFIIKKNPSSNAPYDIGYARGYNNGFLIGYNDGYRDGYNKKC
jgi:hypothetical protein